MKFSRMFDGLKTVYGIRDDGKRGRMCMLFADSVASIVGQLAGGMFYTSFLLQYGLDKSRIGILAFVPYITCILILFSPWFLERFKKRKWVLFAGKLFGYCVNIFGITLLPMLVKDENARLICFVGLTILASAANQLFSSGYSAWKANFLPEEIRIDYFNTSACINAAITWAVTLGVSFVGDSLAGTEHELLMLTVIRFVAFGLAIVDCLIWLLPKEYPYKQTVKAKISTVFTLPLKNKRFLYTILIAVLYGFVSNLPNATLNAYIIEDVGISYVLCNGINATYFLFFFFFSSMWKKFIKRLDIFRACAFALFMLALTYFAYTFVTAERVWLYVVVRLGQHIMGVAVGTIFATLPYVNLPEEDRTSYLSFHSILSNISVFFSMMIGTALTGLMGDRVLTVGGMSFTSTQVLLFLCAVGQVLVGVLAYVEHRRNEEYKRREREASNLCIINNLTKSP